MEFGIQLGGGKMALPSEQCQPPDKLDEITGNKETIRRYLTISLPKGN